MIAMPTSNKPDGIYMPLMYSEEKKEFRSSCDMVVLLFQTSQSEVENPVLNLCYLLHHRQLKFSNHQIWIRYL